MLQWLICCSVQRRETRLVVQTMVHISMSLIQKKKLITVNMFVEPCS